MPSDTGPTELVRLCGAVIRQALADAGVWSATLRITERIHVPDDGVDAECTIPAVAGVHEFQGLVGPGRTAYQFKYRDVLRAAARKVLVTELVRELRMRSNPLRRDYNRYVLMTNLHLASPEMRRLTQALEPAAAGGAKVVVVWGAAEIANALNSKPHLRHIFFAEGGLSTLDLAEAELRAAYRDVGWPAFVDRQAESAALESFLNDPSARVLRVRGPRYSGKTRVVLDTLKRICPSALWAAHPPSVNIELFRDLDSGDERPVLVVDGADDASSPQIEEWAGQRQRLKTIIIQRDTDAYPALQESEVVVSALSEDDARTLLASVLPGLTFALESWMLDASDRLPGLMLHIALLVRDAGLEPTGKPGEVEHRLGRLLQTRYEASLSLEARQALEVIALLPVLGIEGTMSQEADAVAKALGHAPSILRTSLPTLERLALVRRRGRFVAVTPPVLADHLAAGALVAPDPIVAQLEIALSAGRFLSFLDRLARIRQPAVEETIRRLLEKWCGDFDALVRNAERIQVLAPAVPAVAVHCIEGCLDAVPAATIRATLRDRERRAVVWALHDLVFRSETFQRAARLLLVLAEAENETYANNATGLFASLFSWKRPQITVSLSARLAVLEEGLRSSSPARRKAVAEAAGRSFAEQEAFTHHQPRGGRLPEPEYRPATWQEVGDYARGILDVLAQLLEDPVASVRAAAQNSLVAIWAPLVETTLRVEPGPGRLPEVTEQALRMLAELGRSVDNAGARSKIVSRLELLDERLTGAIAAGSVVAREMARRSRELREELVTASFRDKLWWWIGPPSWKQRRRGPDGKEFAAALSEIASAFLTDPRHFETHVDWLLSDDARRATDLLRLLGSKDRRRALLATLLAHSHRPVWPQRFAAYVAGWAEIDPPGASAELGRLIEMHPGLAEGLLRGLASLPYTPETVVHALMLLDRSGLARAQFANLIAWLLPWPKMSPEEAEHVLSAIDDETPAVRQALLAAFGIRIHHGAELSPSLRALAWEFLASSFWTSEGVGYRLDWDDVAAQLGQKEPKRLLAVLERLASDRPPTEEHRLLWHQELPLVWETLVAADRTGLLRLLLRLALRPGAPSEIEWTLSELIIPERDRRDLIEFAREHGVEAARMIGSNIDPDRVGFWEVAQDLLAEWGHDDRLAERLAGRLLSGEWRGSPLPLIAERLQRARALGQSQNPRVAVWAQQAVSTLAEWRRHAERDETEDWIWDYRIRRAELEEMVKRPDSPEWVWAIGRLLKYAPRERVLELLSPEEILDALPRIEDLDERTREIWESWARLWSRPH